MAPANGWIFSRLEEVARTATGGTPSRDNRAYFGGAIPWVKSGELDDNIIYDTEEYLSVDALRNSSAKVFPVGTVLVALYGATVGKTAVLATEAATNQAVCAIFVDSRVLDNRYLRYFLMHVRPDLLGQRYGGAQPNISQTIIRNTPIYYPQLDEQRRITAVLSAVQRAIERQERLIALSTELKKTLMHKLFTEGTRGESLKQTEIGPVPQSWDVAPLGSLWSREPTNGLYRPQSDYGRGTLILRIDDFSNDGDVVTSASNRVDAAEGDHRRFGLAKDDIVLNRVNSLSHLGKTALIGDLAEPMLFESNMMRFRVDRERLRPALAFRLLNSAVCKSQIVGMAKRAVAQSSVNQGDVSRLLIPLPPHIEQQDEILGMFDALEGKMSVDIQAHRSLTDLFHALLHQLMTAQVRVHDLDLSALDEPAGEPGVK